MIWTSLTFAGAVYSIKLKQRITQLENILLMLKEMKIEIEYLNTPVCEMIYKMKSKEYFSRLGFLDVCCTAVGDGSDFPCAWSNAVKNCCHNYKREETDKLLHLGANLGTSNLENQINIIDIHIGYFENYLTKAKITQQKYGNTVLFVSMLTGCMIFIMVI